MSILGIAIAAATGDCMLERMQDRPQKEDIPPFIARSPERRPSVAPLPIPVDESARLARSPSQLCKVKSKTKEKDKESTPAKKSGGDAKQSQRNPGCGERVGGSAARSDAGSAAGMRLGDAEFTATGFDANAAQDLVVLKRNDGGNSDFDGSDMANNAFGRNEKEPFANGSGQAPFSTSSDGQMDFNPLMDKLTPLTSDDGIFEVVLKNGETMGVVVNSHPTHVSFFLTPTTVEMSNLLRSPPQQMELEGQLERRIRRNVKITVL